MNEIQDNGNNTSNLKGLFSGIDVDTPNLAPTVTERQNKLSRLLKIINQIQINSTHSEDIEILGDSYEYLLGKFASGSGKKGGEFYTPKEVSQILANITTYYKPDAKDVYDFACGSGSLLLKAAKNIFVKTGKYPKIYGQELAVTT
jgi:type I restriction enzyme M protein